MVNRINNIENFLIPAYLGKIENWQDFAVDLSKISHLLIIGFTGCGKSTLIHNIIFNILENTNSEEVKIVMYDNKGIELNIYNKCPHLIIPVISEDKKLEGMLNWCMAETTGRLNKLSENYTRTIDEYNENVIRKENKIPHIVIVLDGYRGDNEIENECLEKILLNGRTVGIHVVLSVLETKNAKKYAGSFPAVACFKIMNCPRNIGIPKKDYSNLQIGEFWYKDLFTSEPQRIRTPDIYFSSIIKEIEKNIISENNKIYNSDLEKSIKKAENPSLFIYGDGERDVLFAEAGRFFIEKEKASIGMLQRWFSIGFNRASHITDQLAEAGVISKEAGTAQRKILMSLEEFEKHLENNF